MSALGNEKFQDALNKVGKSSETIGASSMGPVARLPVDIPKSYKKALKSLAVDEDVTMRDLTIEALDLLFANRGMNVDKGN